MRDYLPFHWKLTQDGKLGYKERSMSTENWRSTQTHRINLGGGAHDEMVKAMEYGIVSEFELQSRYFVHFRISTLGKGMKPLIHPAIG